LPESLAAEALMVMAWIETELVGARELALSEAPTPARRGGAEPDTRARPVGNRRRTAEAAAAVKLTSEASFTGDGELGVHGVAAEVAERRRRHVGTGPATDVAPVRVTTIRGVDGPSGLDDLLLVDTESMLDTGIVTGRTRRRSPDRGEVGIGFGVR